MKKILLILCIMPGFLACTGNPDVNGNSLIKSKEEWVLESGLANPESVVYDKERNVLYVSNVNSAPAEEDGNGYISIVSADGKMLTEKWIEGLSAPKGMAITEKYLYVSDINRLVQIDIEKGQISDSYGVEGAAFLNDVAIDAQNNIYVSDTWTNKIHKITNGKISTLIEDSNLVNPNGLKVYDDALYVVSWSTVDEFKKPIASLKKINLADPKLAFIGNPLGNMDGLERISNGWLASDYTGGIVYAVNDDGYASKIVKLETGTADIGYFASTLFIPSMEDNKLYAYSLQN